MCFQTAKKFVLFGQHNPYRRPRDKAFVGRPFWTKEQYLICVYMLKVKKNLFVDVKSIDILHMEKDLAYFGEGLALYQQWSLIPMITFNKDFDSEIFAQFYAIVHFHSDEVRPCLG